MKFHIGILLCLFVFVSNSFGQIPGVGGLWDENYVSWYINYEYADVRAEQFDLVIPLTSPGGTKDRLRVEWGDGTVKNYPDIPSTIDYKYTKGSWNLSLKLYTDGATNDTVTYKKIVFNKGLSGVINIKKLGSKDPCMVSDRDTFLVWMSDTTGNPPSTLYEIKHPNKDLCTIELRDNPDTSLIIFTRPTGPDYEAFNCLVKCENPLIPSRSLKYLSDFVPVQVYRAPKLSDIFSCDTLFKTSLDKIGHIENCTGLPLEYIKYDSRLNFLYQDWFEDPKCGPGEQTAFTAKFYRADSIDGKFELVNKIDKYNVDTANLLFNYPGYYKIEMHAQNQCGVDSMFTDSINGSTDKRYIQVFQNGSSTMARLTRDTSCLDLGRDTILYVDRGARLKWDPVPEYYFDMLCMLNGRKYIPQLGVEYDMPPVVYYRNGVETTDVTGHATDSAIIRLVFVNRVSPHPIGNYEINFIRDNHKCDSVVFKDKLWIGERPWQYTDQGRIVLERDYADRYDRNYDACDTFSYVIPKMTYSSNNLGIDSVMWNFAQGTKIDTLIGYHNGDIYSFNKATDSLNYITVQARNYCGWTTQVDSVGFYRRVVPRVEFWRDSLPNNDSLCINLNYDYYLVGAMPDSFHIRGSFAHRSFINGQEKLGGDEFTLSDTNAFDVLYPAPHGDHFIERLHIYNKKNGGCSQTLSDTIQLLPIPDTIGYRMADTLAYCAGLDTIDSRKLFSGADTVFRFATWQMGTNVIKDKFPKLPLLGGPGMDTLRVRTSNSTGCFYDKLLFFDPQEEPELVFVNEVATTKRTHRCVGDTIRCYTDFIDSENSNDSISLVIYKNKIGHSDSIYYRAVKGEKEFVITDNTPDSILFIYTMINNRVDPAFGMDSLGGENCMVCKCEWIDTLIIDIKRPRLKITKTDTLTDLAGLNFYKFQGLEAAHGIDTNQVTLIGWQNLNDPSGTLAPDGLDGLYDYVYTLSASDKGKDTLTFVLSGTTICGKPISDTLYVLVPNERIVVGEDTICINATDYVLWTPERTHGVFVDSTTLTWGLVPNADGRVYGTLNVPVGDPYLATFTTDPDVITPDDTVKIWVKGANVYDNSQVTPGDTIRLRVMDLPKVDFADTLYTKSTPGLIEVKKIATEFITQAPVNYSDFEWSKLNGKGKWANPKTIDATYTMNSSNNNEDHTERVYIDVKGKAGCAAEVASDTVTLVKIAQPRPRFAEVQYDICEKDTLKFAYTMSGNDHFVKVDLESTEATARFFGDSLYIHGSVANTITLSTLTLKAEKTGFRLYLDADGDGNGDDPAISGTTTVEAYVYQKPTLAIADKYDTVCYSSSNQITIQTSRVTSNYNQNYFSTAHSSGVTGNFNLFTLTGTPNPAMLIVTTDLGQCKKWKDTGDTIFITKLPKVTGTIQIDPNSVCATGTVAASVVNANYRNFTWGASNGTITPLYGSVATFTPSIQSGTGTVKLTITPDAADCIADRLILEKNVRVLAVPDIKLHNDTVCSTLANYTINIGAKDPNTQSIAWTSTGVTAPFAVTTSATGVVYSISVADRARGYVDITATITPTTNCTGTTARTMRLVLQAAPAITDIPGANLEICQGGKLALNALNVVNVSSYSWQNVSMGTVEDRNVLNTNYSPGEYSGTANLTLVAKGYYGCADVSKTINIQVKSAKQPSFTYPTPRCERSEITFVNTTPTTGVNSWEWTVNGIVSGISHTFPTAGDYNVGLKAEYTNGCARTKTEIVSIETLPAVNFSCDGVTNGDWIVGQGIPVEFENLTPGNTTNSVWSFAGGTEISTVGNIRTQVYNTPTASTNVTLTVTNGCTNSMTKSVKVVAQPTVAFDITVDQCDPGKPAVLTNTSVGENVSYLWDFGTGVVKADTLPKNITFPAIYKDSTYNVTLTVTNRAGSKTLTKRVSFVSLLKAQLDLENYTSCTPMEREMYVALNGRADDYTVYWGDGTHTTYTEYMAGYKVSHRYENTTGFIKKDTVYMTAKNVCYADTTDKMIIEIFPNTVKALIVPDTTNICYGKEIVFTNKSSGFGGRLENITWYFNDGSTPVETKDAKVVHPFFKPGTYDVFAVAKDECNTDTSNIIPVTIRGNDSLSFDIITQEPYCSSKSLKMIHTPKGMVNFRNLRWVLGDGKDTIRDVPEVVHSYNRAKDYTVWLRAVAEGCPSQISKTIRVNQNPSAVMHASETVGCEPKTIDFQSLPEATNSKIFWDFKNNATSQEQFVSNTFRKQGLYNVTLTLTTPEGCVDSTSKLITIKHTPEISFTLNDSLFCTTDGNFDVLLDNTSKDIDSTSFEWYSDDRQFSYEKQPDILSLSSKKGELFIKMKAFHNNGCPNELKKRIVSSDKVIPKITLDKDAACDRTEVTFTNQSEYSNSSYWDMGDGTVIRDSNVVRHAYTKPSVYKVKLIARNLDGCSDSILRDINVYPLPYADFTYTLDDRIPDNIGIDGSKEVSKRNNGGFQFTNHSSVKNYNFVESNELFYTWNFGDSTSWSKEASPYHQFTNNGRYNVLLVTETQYRCRDSIAYEVDVTKLAIIKGLYFPTAFSPNMENGEENAGISRFLPKGIGLQNYKVQVYDSWGTCVWSSTKVENGHPAEYWNGEFNGSPLPKGTYLWKASGTFMDGSVWDGDKGKTEGAVMLIR